MMRIITGSARGTKLETLEGENTRPTSERAKMAIFNTLQFDIEGRRVLDLFGGSGQMALEALSRGAREAVLVDKSKHAVGIINKNIAKTKFLAETKVFCADYSEYIRRFGGEKFDIIFLDPPYAAKLYAPALEGLLRAGMLKSTTVIVCESDKPDLVASDPALSEVFEVIKQNRYGIAYVTLITPKKEAAE